VSEAADLAGLKFGTGGSGGTACWGGVYLGIWVEMRLGLHLQGVQEGTRTKEYHGCISCVSIHESIDLLFFPACVYVSCCFNGKRRGRTAVLLVTMLIDVDGISEVDFLFVGGFYSHLVVEVPGDLSRY